MANRLDKNHLMYLYLRWTIPADMAFSTVRDNDFRAFLEYINKPANDMLPLSDTTIRKKLELLYEEGKRRVRLILTSAITSIHITCDGWSSPNYLSLLGVVGHFVDEKSLPHALLLGLKELQGAHTGPNMSVTMLELLNDYSIRSKLGYFVMDNAPNNDTMLRAISLNFRLVDGIEYDPIEHRLRCMGHIINLSVQAFLFGKHPYPNSDESVDCPSDDELQAFRRFGPLGKLHNVVVYIMRDNERIQYFKTLTTKHHMPRRDHQIRWNSWFLMLNWSIDTIKSTLQVFIGNEDALEADRLTTSDWQTLVKIRDFLKPFYVMTKMTEGKLVTLNRVIPVMDYLLTKYEEGAIQYVNDDFMALSIDSGWKVLRKYWNKNNDNAPIYTAAIALDPVHKWGLLREALGA